MQSGRRGGTAKLLRQPGRLVLVHHQGAEDPQHRRIQRADRRKVQHSGDVSGTGAMDESCDLTGVSLHLQQQQGVRVQQGVLDLACAGEGICAGADRDLVAASRVRADGGAARCTLHARDPGQINAGRLQAAQRTCRQGVTSDRAGHRHPRPVQCRRSGLVGAFPTRLDADIGTKHRLAGARKPVEGKDQVKVDGTKDDDIERHGFRTAHGFRPTLGGPASPSTRPIPALTARCRPDPPLPRSACAAPPPASAPTASPPPSGSPGMLGTSPAPRPARRPA